MKNNYSNPKYNHFKRIKFWIVLSTAWLFTSCVSEVELTSSQIGELDKAILDARAWFGSQKEFVLQKDGLQSAKYKTRTKKIYWDKSIAHNTGKVVEVVVEYNAHWVPVKKGETTHVQIEEKQKLAFFRLILEKEENGGYRTFLLKYFPEKEIENQMNLEVNNYNTLSKEFTGDIWMYSWDEENFEKGWKIAEGKITRTFYPKKN